MWNYMNMNMTFGHGIGMILFWIIAISIISYLIFKSNPYEESALDILKRRLAKGEITIVEFENLKIKL